jgi:hypothetical protein
LLSVILWLLVVAVVVMALVETVVVEVLEASAQTLLAKLLVEVLLLKLPLALQQSQVIRSQLELAVLVVQEALELDRATAPLLQP